MDTPEILEFAGKYFADHQYERWNGRQIRNACQTALALAEFRAQGGSHQQIKNANATVHLRVEDIEKVTGAYLEFTKYLNDVHGWDAERLARRLHLRGKDVQYATTKGTHPKGEKENEKPIIPPSPRQPNLSGATDPLMRNLTPMPTSQPQKPRQLGTSPIPPVGQLDSNIQPPGLPVGASYPYQMPYGQALAPPGVMYGAPPPAASVPPMMPTYTAEQMAWMQHQAAQQQAAQQHATQQQAAQGS